jgi:DNA-binding NarL/FixJ family response regulator
VAYIVYPIVKPEESPEYGSTGNQEYVKSVLIVDDSPQVSGLLMAALSESGGVVCEEAGNGREGILQAQRLHPDLIILDLSMPEMNGFDAALELKRIMPAVPLIMFTTHLTQGLERQAMQFGIHCVFSKIDGSTRLISCVSSLLHQR